MKPKKIATFGENIVAVTPLLDGLMIFTETAMYAYAQPDSLLYDAVVARVKSDDEP